jgi:hypothetical protein
MSADAEPPVLRELQTIELIEMFGAARQSGLHVDAIIAVDAHPDLKHALFAQNAGGEFIPILTNTPYATLWQSMPYLQRLAAGCALEAHLLASPEKWGFFAITAAGSDIHCDHWRSLCEVLLPDGSKSFFRFQDARAMRMMLSTFTEQETGWFMGPVARLILPACGQDCARIWLEAVNPALRNRTETELAEAYRPAPERPWWEVREEHLANMAKERRAALVYNLYHNLLNEMPYTASDMDIHYGTLQVGIEAYVDAALGFGLTEDEDITDFFDICLLLPFGAQDGPAVKEAMQDAAQNPRGALMRLNDLAISLDGEQP